MDGPTPSSIHLQIASLVRDIQEHPSIDPQAALDELTLTAARHVPGAMYAGISVITRQRKIETPSATGDYPAILDEIQQRCGQGPCMEAAWEHHTVRVDDLMTDRRWPRYSREATEKTPIRSHLSFQMFASRQSMGALSVFADRARAFNAESVDIGLIYATHAALAWSALRRDQQFRSALASRDTIGQAKGMIMERYKINAVQAFDLIKRLSQESNTPVTDVARQLVEADYPASG
jgi:ANTAR domain/GAF domain